MTVKIHNRNNGNKHSFDSRGEAEEQLEEIRELAKEMDGQNPEDVELVFQGATPQGASDKPQTAADTIDESEGDDAEIVKVESDGPESVPDSRPLQEDPIAWLENINTDFVNTIKGKPAISKQGFRYIQTRFGITTQSEVVQWVDDPTGCIVWAKANLPDGQAAEAHGEGYQCESDVADNEFVRYADTRAKNRAISDLTSAGALAASELSEEP